MVCFCWHHWTVLGMSSQETFSCSPACNLAYTNSHSVETRHNCSGPSLPCLCCKPWRLGGRNGWNAPCVSYSLTGHNTVGLLTIFMTEYVHLYLETRCQYLWDTPGNLGFKFLNRYFPEWWKPSLVSYTHKFFLYYIHNTTIIIDVILLFMSNWTV